MKTSPAFTIIEILLVFAITAIILIPAYSSYVRSRANSGLQASAEELANVLRQAHVFSRELRGEVDWGVQAKADPDGDLTGYILIKNQELPEPIVEKSYQLHRDTIFMTNFTIWFQKNDGTVPSAGVIILKNKYGQQFKVTVLVTGVVEVKAL